MITSACVIRYHLICGLPRAQRYYSTLIHIPYIQYACLRLGQGIVRDCRHIRKHSFIFFLITGVVQNYLNRPTRPSGGRRRRRRFGDVKKKKYPYNPLNATHSIIGDSLQFTFAFKSTDRRSQEFAGSVLLAPGHPLGYNKECV
jgi:hypothetical protein